MKNGKQTCALGSQNCAYDHYPTTFSDMSAGLPLSVCAGAFAALASVSSKLALEQDGRTIRYFLPCGYLSELNCTYVSIM